MKRWWWLILMGLLSQILIVQAQTLEPIREIPDLQNFPGEITELPSTVSNTADAPLIIQPERLSAEQTQALLQRLQPLPAAETAVEFKPPAQPEPPPPTEIIEQPFPPTPNATHNTPVQTSVQPAGSVQIVRFAPQGEVKFAKQISVTFDRPMVAVGSSENALAQSSPVQLTPAVEGQWRWLDSKTILFTPKTERLPMATQFTLTVPAGTPAADGSRLAQDFNAEFATPALSVTQFYPQQENVSLQPVLFFSFDQRVVPVELLSAVQLATAEGEVVELRLASDADLRSDTAVEEWVKQALPEQWLAAVPTEPLKVNTQYTVQLKAGATSDEGERVTEQAQAFEFKTYGPLQVVDKQCQWDATCRPDMDWNIQLSQSLAAGVDIKEWVTVEPALAQQEVSAPYGSALIEIKGERQPRTTYKVTLKAGLTDIFGQVLEQDIKLDFPVTDYLPELALNQQDFITLDPTQAPQFSFYSRNYRNVKWRVQRVKPSDWPTYRKLIDEGGLWQAQTPTLPGETVESGILPLSEQLNEPVLKTVDLKPWLTQGKTGQLLIMLEAGEPLLEPIENAEAAPTQRHLTWLQATQLGIDAANDNQQVLAWVSRLTNGQPIAQAQVRYIQADLGTITGVTQAQGLALLAKPTVSPAPEPATPTSSWSWIEAQAGEDVAFLPVSSFMLADMANSLNTSWLWHVLDDRQLYRPTEEVHLKGWVRQIEQQGQGELGLPATTNKNLHYVVKDEQGQLLGEGDTSLAGLGGFDLAFAVPDKASLGWATVELTMQAADQTEVRFDHRFQIQEFRTPEFEVSVAKQGQEPFIASQLLQATVNAQYYAGGALGETPVTWLVRAETATFTPPNWSEWSFGINPGFPWWRGFSLPTGSSDNVAFFNGKTDAQGLHTIQVQLNKYDLPRPLSISAEATIQDSNQQAWAENTTWLVHPAAVYVGLKTERYFVEQGEPLRLDVVAVDLNGKVVPQQAVVVEAARQVWSAEKNALEAVDTQLCRVLSDAEGLASCVFKTEQGGLYQLTATLQDADGRRNVTQLSRWVLGGEQQALPKPEEKRISAQSLQLLADKAKYSLGETAKVLLQAPFANAQGVATLERNGLLAYYPFVMQGQQHTLELPLKREWMPSVHLQVTLIGEQAGKPALAAGATVLALSTAERALSVVVTPTQPEVSPSTETEVQVQVMQANGQAAANADVVLMVVDEAVLALSDYQLADPLQSFYPERAAGVGHEHGLETVWLSDAIDLHTDKAKRAAMRPMAAPAMAAGGFYRSSDSVVAEMTASGAGSSTALFARQNFTPLAAFLPNLKTNAQGQVSARFTLPDNLTRYRLMAVASLGAAQFGKGEGSLTARLPFMVRPSAPRFLNFGDEFNFPVVLQNQTEQPLAVQVVMAGQNMALAEQGYALTVPAQQRVLVNFPAKPLAAGSVLYQVGAVAGEYQDAATGRIVVQTPATNEAFATYGVVDQGAIRQPIATPNDVWPQFGGLEVSTASTALQSLTDAFLYLQQYPFECSEQLASRVMATASLKDVLGAFQAADMPSAEAMQASIQKDLKLLLERQDYNGSFGLWRRGDRDWPYASLHVWHALVRAQAKGYSVPVQNMQQAWDYARSIENYLLDEYQYTPQTRQAIIAYSLYIRSLLDDFDRERARQLIKDAGGATQLPTDVIAWLIPVLTGDADSAQVLGELRRVLANQVQETAAGASFGNANIEQAYITLTSETRSNALVLQALMQDQPKSDLIPKVVKNLQAQRTQGRWSNTQDNAFVLMALDDYFQTYEAQTPDFVARTWLGKDYVGEQAFQGRSLATAELTIPMSWLLNRSQPQDDLTLAKQGEGRLYYRIGMRYAPKSFTMAAKDQGFVVTRRYEGVDNPADVQQQADGTWVVKAGARVAVKLTFSAPATRYHVALVDPLPAGLEALNPALATSQADAYSPAASDPYLRWHQWFEHQNLRTTQAEAFTTWLAEGSYEYSYLARATTVGTFIVPPAKAEEMYAPETFGRSASTRVIVK